MRAGRSTGGGTQRVTSALTKLRGILGDGPDGSLLVPRRLGDEPIDLSPHVGCDLDRALAHLALAEDLPGDLRARVVAAALKLVRGEPFEGTAYSWATDIAQRAITRLQDAALEAARDLRDAGELHAAGIVIEQGLQLLDPNGWLYLERAKPERVRGHPDLSSLLASSSTTGASSPTSPTRSPAPSPLRLPRSNSPPAVDRHRVR